MNDVFLYGFVALFLMITCGLFALVPYVLVQAVSADSVVQSRFTWLLVKRLNVVLYYLNLKNRYKTLFFFLLIWWPLSKCVSLITKSHMSEYIVNSGHGDLAVVMIVATESISELLGYIFAATIVALYNATINNGTIEPNSEE